MSYRQGQDVPASYTDGIKVKISERYKPPRKINLALSYSQRLSLNKQIQDSIPNYTFELEKSALEYANELKTSRKKSEERKERLLEIRKQMELDEQKQTEEETKTVEEAPATEESYLNYPTSTSMLMPTVNTYLDILTPIPLNSTVPSKYSVAEKRPFNISDFEDDTSSPFDSVALKSINDMEELAKVLKPGEEYKPVASTYSGVYQNYTPMPMSLMGYNAGQYNSYNIPSTMSYAPPNPVASNYSHVNGYYYTSPDVLRSPLYRTEASGSCKSVPDIIKSLEEELKNTSFEMEEDKSVRRPKSIDAVYPKPKVKEVLKDPLADLNGKQKEMCRSIGSMGFPLERVVRVWKILGDDQKKIVDHLLAMSELLDLGFAEKDVSAALLQFDNDRDRALDKLVS